MPTPLWMGNVLTTISIIPPNEHIFFPLTHLHNDIAASETTAHLVTLQRRVYTTNPIYTACLAYPIYI